MKKPILVSAAALAILEFLHSREGEASPPDTARIHHWKDGGGPFEFEFINDHGEPIRKGCPRITKDAFDELIGFDCLSRTQEIFKTGIPRDDTKGIFRINATGRRMYEEGYVPVVKLTERQREIINRAIDGNYLIGGVLNHRSSQSVALFFSQDGKKAPVEGFTGQTFDSMINKRLIRFNGTKAPHPFMRGEIRLWEISELARHSVGRLNP